MGNRWARPDSVPEALGLLADDEDATPIAGGTDLVVAARQGRRRLPGSLVAIDRLAELCRQQVVGGDLLIGAMTTHEWLATARTVTVKWTALADAAAIIGSPATRNTGSIGGNVMNASPAAETVGPLIAAGAVVRLASVDGIRDVEVASLNVGPGRTIAKRTELLTSLRLPTPPPFSGSAYVRLEYRRAMEIAIVGVSAKVTLDGADPAQARIVNARIALTSVAPTVIRASSAEEALLGERPDKLVILAAGAAAAADAKPISDIRASLDYRRQMVAVVAARALTAAIRRAMGELVPVPASRWAMDWEA
jgi:CO/xanthine dehydrogenase FAD-binding subunit